MAFRYSVYGLNLSSNHEISGLIAASDSFASSSINRFQPHQPDPADVVVNFDSEPDCDYLLTGPWISEPLLGIEGGPSMQERKAPTRNGFYTKLRFADERDWVDFFLSPSGDAINIRRSENAPLQNIVALLVGPVLGRVLRLRGETCLHANAVQIGNHAIAIAGNKGTGKSTTTAALLQAGCRVVADDIVTLRATGNEFRVFPGHPALRLCPDAAQALLGSATSLQPVFVELDDYSDYLGKQYLRLMPNLEASANFATSPLPLSAIYLLETRESEIVEPSIESISPQEALITLVQHTFASYTLDARQRANEFAFLGHLVKHVPLRRVRRPDDLSLLSRVAHLIREDAQSLCADTAK